MKRVISLIAAAALMMSLITALPAEAAEGVYEETVKDLLIFGDEASEREHNLTEKMSVAGTDDKAEKQYQTEDGVYAGGGLGDGLTYRQILKPSQDAPKETGFLRFTLKADPAVQNYITVRLSGSQYARGNLMLYTGDDDKTYFDPFAGREYSELDNGYYTAGNSSVGRYYYATMKIPQEIVKADGTVDLKIVPTGRIQAYGASVYANVTQDSKYIYSIASHTEPYYTPQDDKKGYAVTGTPAKTQKVTAYEYLQNEVYDMMTLLLSWQCWGETWENKKTDENAFMDGAIIRNQTIDTVDLTGSSDEVARRHTLEAINHQNWSTMSNLMMIANAFMFDFSKDYYHNTQLLDRYIRLLDFYQRAQDAKGGWCYYTSGEDKGKWLGVSLDGTGQRLTGDWWPLMSLGVDAMMQSFIQLNNYIVNGTNEEFKEIWKGYLDEKIDGDLTGKGDRTRRDYYMDMFGRLRDRLANPERGVGDFYAPTNRAGTANQDFGFAYSDNKAMELLGETAGSVYQPEDEKQYTDMIRYKYGEMADGQKWFSDENTLGLEYGVSHGGWAGDYGPLLIEITDKYAESAQHFDETTKELFDKTAAAAYESAKYFFYPAVDGNGETILNSEVYASARNNGYGLKISYPVAGYTATKLGSQGALRFLAKYIHDNRGYSDTLRADIENKTPHFGVMATDSLDLYNANFFEERHFSNNNNILMVTHTKGQEKSTTSAWGGDMNNKSVPIHFIIRRTGDTIEYWFSLDDGKTYEQTSKPKVTLKAAQTMYVGFCMTAQKEVENTAYIDSDVSIRGELVGADIQKGETVELDFSTADQENDPMEFSMVTELPEGAALDGQKISFTPLREGEYTFTASVKDPYHTQPTVKTVKVNVAPVIKLKINGSYVSADVSPYLSNDRTMVPIRVVSEALGADVDWNQDSRTVTIQKGGKVIVLTIDSEQASVDGQEVVLDAPALIYQSRTFVPIRFVSENIGWNVQWDPDEYIVLVQN